MAVLSYRYRIYPNKTQGALLSEMLADFCGLYNCALEHRIKAYEKGVSIRCNDQITSLPTIRKDLPHMGRWSCTAQQQVLRKLDKTFKAFFSRCKRGQTPGFPVSVPVTVTTPPTSVWATGSQSARPASSASSVSPARSG